MYYGPTTRMYSRAIPPRGQSFRDAARSHPERCRRDTLHVHTGFAAYFFSGSDDPGCLNGNVLNIDFAWFCICSCICTNMFFDCSM